MFSTRTFTFQELPFSIERSADGRTESRDVVGSGYDHAACALTAQGLGVGVFTKETCRRMTDANWEAGVRIPVLQEVEELTEIDQL